MRMNRMGMLSGLLGCAGLALALPAHAAVVYLDLGANAIQGGAPPAGYESHVYSWNTVQPTGGFSIADLVDSAGNSTGLGVTVSDQFKGTNSSGPTAPAGSGMEFWQGANDSLYLARNNAQPPNEVTGGITFTGLDPNATYDIKMLGAHNNLTLSARYLSITVTGESVTNLPEYLTTTHNGSNTISALDIVPSETGTIVIDFAFGPSTAAGDSFVYINAIKLTANAIPEPTSIALLGAGAVGLLVRRRR